MNENGRNRGNVQARTKAEERNWPTDADLETRHVDFARKWGT